MTALPGRVALVTGASRGTTALAAPLLIATGGGPGLVLTGSVMANLQLFADEPNRETPLFVGRSVAALAADPDVLRLSGRWLVAAEVAAAYGVTDEHRHLPASNRPAILGEPVPASLLRASAPAPPGVRSDGGRAGDAPPLPG